MYENLNKWLKDWSEIAGQSFEQFFFVCNLSFYNLSKFHISTSQMASFRKINPVKFFCSNSIYPAKKGLQHQLILIRNNVFLSIESRKNVVSFDALVFKQQEQTIWFCSSIFKTCHLIQIWVKIFEYLSLDNLYKILIKCVFMSEAVALWFGWNLILRFWTKS